MSAVVLPAWPAGTVAVLGTVGRDGAPGAIPVSTAIRASEDRVLLALGRRRATLAALRADPRAALVIQAAGNVSVTLHGHATVVADAPEGAEGIAVVALAVERVQDHDGPRFVIAEGVRWSWADEEARERDAAVRAVLRRLAALG